MIGAGGARRRWQHAALLVLLVVLLLLAVVGRAEDEVPTSPEANGGGGSKSRADSPLWPATARDAAGLVCITIGLLIAAGGGIGGGGIIVAILILVQGCSPQEAIPISGVTVLGGAIANTLSAAVSRHPLAKHRPLIDFDVVLLLELPTVVGALIGTFLNKVLPSVVVVILLVIVLGAMGWRTMKKGMSLLKAEGGMGALCRVHEPAGAKAGAAAGSASNASAIEMGAAANAAASSNGAAEPAARVDAGGASKEEPEQEQEQQDLTETVDDLEVTDMGPPMPTRLARKSTLHFIGAYFAPWKVALLVTFYVGILLLTIFRGQLRRKHCGSLGYWLLSASVLPWTAAFFWAIRRGILQEVRTKEAQGYQWVQGDVHWTPSSSLVFPGLCTIAGMMAGLFGVGGGIVKGPLMLEMGMLPPVVAACSATMILMTATASTLSFITFGMLKPDWALSYFAWGFLCTSVGDRTVKVLLRKYKKQSPIVLSIGIVVVLAAVLMTGESIQKMIQDPGSVKRVGKICS